jgi:hypothetical protein
MATSIEHVFLCILLIRQFFSRFCSKLNWRFLEKSAYECKLQLFISVIPQDDRLMDLWIAGLLGLSSRKTIDAGF